MKFLIVQFKIDHRVGPDRFVSIYFDVDVKKFFVEYDEDGHVEWDSSFATFDEAVNRMSVVIDENS